MVFVATNLAIVYANLACWRRNLTNPLTLTVTLTLTLFEYRGTFTNPDFAPERPIDTKSKKEA